MKSGFHTFTLEEVSDFFFQIMKPCYEISGQLNNEPSFSSKFQPE